MKAIVISDNGVFGEIPSGKQSVSSPMNVGFFTKDSDPFVIIFQLPVTGDTLGVGGPSGICRSIW
jgi:hypothetical protein